MTPATAPSAGPDPATTASSSGSAEPLPAQLSDLILARLLPSKNSVGISTLHSDLNQLYHGKLSKRHVEQALTQLREAGLLESVKGQRLSDSGRKRALAYLGLSQLPARLNWPTVRDKYLLAKALGGAAPADYDKLAALLLKRRLDLPVGTTETLNGVFEAIACRVLGFRDYHSLRQLRPLLLAKSVGSNEPLSEPERVLPRVLLDCQSSGLRGMRQAALSEWLDPAGAKPVTLPNLLAGAPASPDDAATGTAKPRSKSKSKSQPQPQPTAPAQPLDLQQFARTVLAAARACPTGWFGDDQVFINHVWKQLADHAELAHLGLEGFKEKLIEAHQKGLLELRRADLVQLMDPHDVAESTARLYHAVFNFIRVNRH
jgi:DNA-binding transcriptional ArsR family regulator